MNFCGLPYEVKELIFSILPPEDLFRCLGVCQEWRAISNSERLWLKTLSKKHIDLEPPDSVEEKINDSSICKYALLWKLYYNTCRSWYLHTFVQRLIPYDTSEDLTCCRIYVYKEKMAVINNKIQLFSFTRKTFTKESISLPFVPHNVTMNYKYIVSTIGNSVLVYRKSETFQKYCAITLPKNSSPLNIQTNKFRAFLAAKLKYGPYLKTDAILGDYLWLSCLNENGRHLCVVNLRNFNISNISIDARFLVVTQHKVMVSTGKSIHVFNFEGDLHFSFTPQQEFNSFRATDHFIVTFVQYGYNATIYSVEGKRIWAIDNPGPIQVDPKRRLLYTCALGNKAQLNAYSLETGQFIWKSCVHDVNSSEIDDLFLICGKFLIVNVYSDTVSPVSHFGLVYDLDEHKLLYKINLRGYTMHVSDYLWVQKRQNDLIVNTY